MISETDDKPFIPLIYPPCARLNCLKNKYIDPLPITPDGILYIATFLVKNGYNSMVYNADFKLKKEWETEEEIWDSIEKLLDEEILPKNPKIIGISIVSPQYAAGFRLSE